MTFPSRLPLKSYLLLIIMFTSAVSYAQDPWLSSSHSERIDAYIARKMKTDKIPGLALAITRDGRIVKRVNAGLASIEHRVPVTDSSRFWIASVSKQFTTSAIMLLSQENLFEIDHPVKDYLPELPASWNNITIRHLMTHTSGLPVSGSGSERGTHSVNGTYSAEEMIRNAMQDTLSFTPGARYLYSDEGIFLLGYLIHRISGMSFREFMQKRIFDATGMHTAYLMDQFTVHPNQVTGYAMLDGRVVSDRNYWRLLDTEINAAGGIYASIEDMVAWENALLTNDLLTKETKDMMWTSFELADGRHTYYGFGWHVHQFDGERIIYHPGVAGSEYLRFPDRGISIILLTNQKNYRRSITYDIAEILGLIPPADLAYFGLSEEDIARPTRKEIRAITGNYQFYSEDDYYNEMPLTIEASGTEINIHTPTATYPIVKLKTEKWLQLSWELVLDQLTYAPLQDGNTDTLRVYSTHNEATNELVGIMVKE